jgi:predicted permease
MMSYWQLLLLILPVFAMIAIGVGLRRAGWMTGEADSSILKMVVNCLFPCLIFENVINNAALREPSNLAIAPLVAFVTMAGSILLALQVGRWLGLTQGHGLRTFAFAAGINNYGYIPIPLMAALFGADSVGLLLVHNVGCEAAIWTVGILVLSGLSLREGWRKLINAPVVALILALAVNLLNLGPKTPAVVLSVIHQCAVCAIPLGLILIGGNLDQYLSRPQDLFAPKLSTAAVAVRLVLLPVVYLTVAKFLPCSVDLKRVIVVQAAMPSGILSMVIARHYGGQPLTAVQVVMATTVVGVFVIPLWLSVGLAWVLGA